MNLKQKIIINNLFTSGNRKDERGICTDYATFHTCRKKTEISKVGKISSYEKWKRDGSINLSLENTDYYVVATF